MPLYDLAPVLSPYDPNVNDYDLVWGISEGEDVNLDWARSDGLRWTPRELSSD